MQIAICDDDLREQEQFEKALRGWDSTRSAEKYVNGIFLLKKINNKKNGRDGK